MSRVISYRVIAGLASMVVAGVGLLIAYVGAGRYFENYCHQQAWPPGMTEATASGRGPVFDGPITVRCIWDEHADVVITDPKPLIWWSVVALLVLASIITMWVTANKATRSLEQRRALSRS